MSTRVAGAYVGVSARAGAAHLPHRGLGGGREGIAMIHTA